MSNLTVEKREKNSNLRNLRLGGKVPATIYGNKEAPASITMSNAELTKASSIKGFFSRVITLMLDNKKVDVLAKDIQRDPLHDVPVHADFMRVNKEQKVRISVSIDYINSKKSPAMKKGGVLNIVKHRLEVRCSPYEIPTELVCDLFKLETDDSVTLSSLTLPKNVVPVHPERDNVLATVVAAAVEEKEEEAEAETEEAATEEKKAAE